jgi:hypothetical protein
VLPSRPTGEAYNKVPDLQTSHLFRSDLWEWRYIPSLGLSPSVDSPRTTTSLERLDAECGDELRGIGFSFRNDHQGWKRYSWPDIWRGQYGPAIHGNSDVLSMRNFLQRRDIATEGGCHLMTLARSKPTIDLVNARCCRTHTRRLGAVLFGPAFSANRPGFRKQDVVCGCPGDRAKVITGNDFSYWRRSSKGLQA